MSVKKECEGLLTFRSICRMFPEQPANRIESALMALPVMARVGTIKYYHPDDLDLLVFPKPHKPPHKNPFCFDSEAEIY